MMKAEKPKHKADEVRRAVQFPGKSGPCLTIGNPSLERGPVDGEAKTVDNRESQDHPDFSHLGHEEARCTENQRSGPYGRFLINPRHGKALPIKLLKKSGGKRHGERCPPVPISHS